MLSALFPVPKLMREIEEPGEQAYLSRTEVEMELARLALVVMRAAPASFEDLGARGRPPRRCDDEIPAELASRLLRRTRPEHRPFVESRLLELARCLAGVRTGEVHELLNLGVALPERPAADPYATPKSSRR